MVVYLSLPDYISQWFVHEQGGHIPVRLMRGSLESAMLEQWICRLPDGAQPQTAAPGLLPVEIPSFRARDPRVYNFLPPKGHDALVSMIRERFDVDMWSQIHRFANVLKRKDELIFAFMESRGIELTETNWNAVAKRYARKRDSYMSSRRRKVQKK